LQPVADRGSYGSVAFVELFRGSIPAGDLQSLLSKNRLTVQRDDFVVIDLTFLLETSEKSYYSAPLILGSKSENNAVLYGVARDLLRLRKTLGIGHAVVVIGREARAISSDTTINSVVRFLKNLGAGVVYQPHAASASLCKHLAPKARWVVTKNRALFQLISNDFEVIVPNPDNRGFDVVTLESLTTSLGIRPDQIPSFLALTEGGKNGVLTSRQTIHLLEIHGNLEQLLRNTSIVSREHLRQHLSANKDLLLSRLCDLMLQQTRVVTVKQSRLAFIDDEDCAARILHEYGFWSLVRLLPRSISTGIHVSATPERGGKYKAIQSEAEMQELEAVVAKSEVCAIDTEATDKDPRSASLLGVAFAVKGGEAFYVPLAQAGLEEASTGVIRVRLRRIFAGPTGFVGHNIKFDHVLLRQHGITIKHVSFDTMLAAYECFGDWESFNLAVLTKTFLSKDIKT
jgi:DNA polymerase-1